MSMHRQMPCSKRQRPQGRVRETPFIDDPCQHRESRECNACAEEQRGIRLTDTGGEQTRHLKEQRRNQYRNSERGRDARHRHHRRRLGFAFEMIKPQRRAHQKHVQTDT